MAKSYGGGAGAGGSGEVSMPKAIGNAPPKSVYNEYIVSKQRYNYDVLEAVETEPGVIEMDWAKGKGTQINNNRVVYDIPLKAGVYQQPGMRRFTTHNIDWNLVNEVSAPYGSVIDLLREKGFHFDRQTRTWKK